MVVIRSYTVLSLHALSYQYCCIRSYHQRLPLLVIAISDEACVRVPAAVDRTRLIHTNA